MTHGRHRRPLYLVPLLAAAASTLVIVGVFWASDQAPSDRAPSERSDEGRATAASERSRTEAALAACLTAKNRVAGMEAATSTAIQQWRLHIGAMNQLLAGKITLAQAKAFWESTRVEGQRTMRVWLDPDEAFGERPPHCEPVAGVPAHADAALDACVERVAAADRLVARARTTLADWWTHIRHMEALRAGTLDPDHAAQLWQQVYKRAGPEISAYDEAYAQLADGPGCRGV